MKIVLNYDEHGNLTENNGSLIITYKGLGDHVLVEKKGPSITVEEVLQLKEAGLESEEIIAMKKTGVI